MSELKTSNKIDAFLNKTPRVIKQISQMVDETNEFPGRQQALYNLMKLTGDVSTLSGDLIRHLYEDKDLAKKIVEKARLNRRLASSPITTTQLRQSIQRLGYGPVNNEVQNSLAKKYIRVYYETNDQDVRTLLKKSIRLAFIARELARVLNYPEVTQVFFIGMSYYLGEMVLALRSPRTYRELKRMMAKGVDQKSAELAVLGYNLSDLAVGLLYRWGLPTSVIDVVRNSDNVTEVKASNYKSAIMMKFAEYVSDALSNKKSSPQSMWDRAYDYMNKLNTPISVESWVKEIKLMYLRVLETEYSLYQR